jgi:hypothetical protein
MLSQKILLIAKPLTPLPPIYRLIYLSMGVMDISFMDLEETRQRKDAFH